MRDIIVPKSDGDPILFQAARAGVVTLLQHIRVETDLRRRRRGGEMLRVVLQGRRRLQQILDEASRRRMN
eukprot:11201363-Alexandrium_andersonii.AAC.1